MNPKWSFIAYLAGDNDLSDIVRNDVNTINNADPANVLAIYQADLPGVNTARVVVDGNGGLSLGVGGNVNSADFRTLAEFLTEAKKFRRTKYIAVHLSAHGTGFVDFTFANLTRVPNANRTLKKSVEGLSNAFFTNTISRAVLLATSLGPDTSVANTAIRDFLDNQELETALRLSMNGDGRYDIIACDACLMGMVEVAHQFRKVGKYFVASQDNINNDAWPLEENLGAFNDSVSPKQMAKEIVNFFTRATAADPFATLSTVDLDRMDALATALNQLGEFLLPFVATNHREIADVRKNVRKSANRDYIDLFGLAAGLRSTALAETYGAIEEAAGAVCDAVEDAVIATNQRPDAHGLCVYLPNRAATNEYDEISLTAAAPMWRDFVVEYGKHFTRPSV